MIIKVTVMLIERIKRKIYKNNTSTLIFDLEVIFVVNWNFQHPKVILMWSISPLFAINFATMPTSYNIYYAITPISISPLSHYIQLLHRTSAHFFFTRLNYFSLVFSSIKIILILFRITTFRSNLLSFLMHPHNLIESNCC